MEISDALVTAITRELLRRLESGELKFTEANKTCPGQICTTPVVHTGSPPAQGRKRVISEADIIRLCPASAGTGQIVELGSRDLITPLAEDYIAKMRITVNRIG